MRRAAAERMADGRSGGARAGARGGRPPAAAARRGGARALARVAGIRDGMSRVPARSAPRGAAVRSGRTLLVHREHLLRATPSPPPPSPLPPLPHSSRAAPLPAPMRRRRAPCPSRRSPCRPRPRRRRCRGRCSGCGWCSVLHHQHHALRAERDEQVVHLEPGEHLGQRVPVLQVHRRASADSSSRRLGLKTVAPAYSKNWRNLGSTTMGIPRRRATSITAAMSAGGERALVVVLEQQRVGVARARPRHRTSRSRSGPVEQGLHLVVDADHLLGPRDDAGLGRGRPPATVITCRSSSRPRPAPAGSRAVGVVATVPTSRQAAPSAATLAATLAAPPSACVSLAHGDDRHRRSGPSRSVSPMR